MGGNVSGAERLDFTHFKSVKRIRIARREMVFFSIYGIG
jgi:hypothetical protein